MRGALGQRGRQPRAFVAEEPDERAGGKVGLPQAAGTGGERGGEDGAVKTGKPVVHVRVFGQLRQAEMRAHRSAQHFGRPEAGAAGRAVHVRHACGGGGAQQRAEVAGVLNRFQNDRDGRELRGQRCGRRQVQDGENAGGVFDGADVAKDGLTEHGAG